MSLSAWENFYVIVGSSAAALTGLMFVVITLIADFDSTERQVQAFGTPTVVHFSAVLLQSAILSAPWPLSAAMGGLRIALVSFGSAGVAYMLVVLRRARRQTDYKPVIEDWLFHAVFPLAAYGSIAAAAGLLPRRPTLLLFVIGSGALALLFVGIHNAWDTVTYVVVSGWEKRRRRGKERS